MNANSPTLLTVNVGYGSYRAEEWSGGAGLAFRNMGFTGSDPCYLHKARYGTKTKSKDTVFALYALDDGLPARADKSILLQVIDPDSQQSYDLEEFRRNDFITVNIAVTIHPDGGWFEFKVIPCSQERDRNFRLANEITLQNIILNPAATARLHP